MPLVDITGSELFTLQCAVENLRSADKTDERIEAAWRIASKIEALVKRINQQITTDTKEN